MVPVESQVIAWSYFDGVVGLDVAHDVAAHVDRGEVLDGGVIVAAFPVLTVVSRYSDAGEGALIDAVDEDALGAG